MGSMQAINGTVPGCAQSKAGQHDTSRIGVLPKESTRPYACRERLAGFRGKPLALVRRRNTSIRCLAGQAELRRTWPWTAEK